MAATSKTVNAAGGASIVPESPLYELVAGFNDLIDKYEALLAKLDSDTGITDTDYESTVGGSRKLVFSEIGEPNA